MVSSIAGKLIIRRAAADEAALISALVRRTVRVSNAKDYPPRVIAQVFASFAPEWVRGRMARRQMFVAELAGRIVGTISASGGEINSLFVEPGFQRHGIGRSLVAFVERQAKAAGLTDLALSASITARRFYERIGYRTETFEERVSGATFLMRKRLE